MKFRKQNPSSHLLPNDKPLSLNSQWIWAGGFEKTVDSYALFRKKFTITKTKAPVLLHITASSSYTVFINGKEIGRGPNPSSLGYFYVDSYRIGHFLRTGDNVIAIQAWNSYLGLHSSPRRPAGIIAQIDDFKGNVILCTDGTWKVKVPGCWNQMAPRLFWTLGFAEYFDFNSFPENWDKTRN